VKDIIRCANCGIELHEIYNSNIDERTPCPSCGSKHHAIQRTIIDEINVVDITKTKSRHGTSGKPFRKTTDGSDLCRKTGQYMKKHQLIDRDNDLYEEIITDPETEQIIHHCKEPLSKHTGHGNARKKTENNERKNN